MTHDFYKTPKPKVFISYAHESAEHQQWVAKLQGALTSREIFAVVDDDENFPVPMDLNRFVEGGITIADHIVLICTPEYKNRTKKDEGGVANEYRMITGMITRNEKNRNQVLLLLRSGDKANAIPTFFGDPRYLDFRSNDSFESDVDKLVTILGRQSKPAIVRLPDDSTKVETVRILASSQLARLGANGGTPRAKAKLYELAAQLQPKAEYHREAAMYALISGDTALALFHDAEAVSINPNLVYAWVGLTVEAALLLDIQLLETAFAEVCLRSSFGDLHHIEASFFYGNYMLRANKPDQARKHLQVVADCTFEDPWFRGLRSRAKMGLRRLEDVFSLTETTTTKKEGSYPAPIE